jgi:hypothetical protein
MCTGIYAQQMHEISSYMFRHSMGSINWECRIKLIFGAWELGRAIYEIDFRESSTVGENICLY